MNFNSAFNTKALQDFDYKVSNLGGNINLIGNITKSISSSTKIGYVTSVYSNEILLNQTDMPYSPSYSNNYDLNQLYIETKFKKKVKSFSVNAELLMRKTSLEVADGINSSLFFEPTLGLTYETLVRNAVGLNFKGLYNRVNEFLDPNRLYSQNVFTSFRTIDRYSVDGAKPTRKNTFLAQINVLGKSKSTIALTAESLYTVSENDLFPTLTITEDIVSTIYNQGANTTTNVNRISLNKYIKPLRTSLKLTFENSLNTQPLIFQNQDGRSRIDENKYSVLMGTVWHSSVITSLGYNRVKSKNDFLTGTVDFSYTNYVGKLNITPFERFNIKTDVQIWDFKGSSGFNTVLNLDLSYSAKNKKWELTGFINNLLGNDTIIIQQLFPSFESNSVYQMQERFFLISLKHRF